MNSQEIEDKKISRHKCGQWIYAGNACEVCGSGEKVSA